VLLAGLAGRGLSLAAADVINGTSAASLDEEDRASNASKETTVTSSP
jgi:hypothetical protein